MDFKSNQHTNSDQIAAYLNGEMTDKEAILFESHINQCEFCNDALEGIEMMPTNKISYKTKFVLKRKLQQKIIHKQDALNIQIWQMIGITAVILVISSISVFVLNQKYQIENKNSVFEVFRKNHLELKEPKVQAEEIILKNTNSQIKRINSIKKKEDNILKSPKFENNFEYMSKITLKKNEIEIIKDLEFQIDENSDKDDLIKIEKEVKGTTTNDLLFESKIAISTNENDFFGKTFDQNKSILPGVSIKLKGLNIGTISDENGNFNLKNILLNQILVFSSIGSKTKEIKVVELKKSLNVFLEEDSKTLFEVIVKGKFENDVADLQSIKPIMGWVDLKKYIKQNVNYPEDAKLNKINGKVILRMNISESGRVISYSYLKKLGFGCDEEALRVLREILWEPAIVDGKKANSSIKLAIKFGN